MLLVKQNVIKMFNIALKRPMCLMGMTTSFQFFMPCFKIGEGVGEEGGWRYKILLRQ